jgi:DNA-binding GntR family transcriptional regulator
MNDRNLSVSRMWKLQKWSFRGIRAEVSVILKRAIFEGIYEPGQQIYEAELAKTLNLSRGPIREALLQLEKESLVQHVFNRGWFVIELAPEKLREIIGLRAVLEVVALKLVKQNATPRELKRLQKIQMGMVAAHERQDIDAAIRADFDFHQELWKICGHKVLEDTLKTITTPYFAFFRVTRLQDPVDVANYGESIKNHQEILEFLAGNSDKTAERCIEHHFRAPVLGDWKTLLNLICK